MAVSSFIGALRNYDGRPRDTAGGVLTPPHPSHGLEDEGLSAEDWIALTSANRRNYRGLARRILRAYPLEHGRVLDFGCGDGSLLALLAEGWPAAVEMLGVDIHDGLIRWAARRRGRPNLTFRRIDIDGGDLPPASQDLVLSTFVCHHWNEPGTFFERLLGLAKPGGRIYVEDIDPTSLHSRLHASSLFSLIFRPARKDFEGYRHSRREAFPPAILRQTLRGLGVTDPMIRRRRGRVMIRIPGGGC